MNEHGLYVPDGKCTKNGLFKKKGVRPPGATPFISQAKAGGFPDLIYFNFMSLASIYWCMPVLVHFPKKT